MISRLMLLHAAGPLRTHSRKALETLGDTVLVADVGGGSPEDTQPKGIGDAISTGASSTGAIVSPEDTQPKGIGDGVWR